MSNLLMRFLLFVLVVSFPLGTAAHEILGVPAENQSWYQNVETNVEARPTFPHGWVKCCNHAEVIPIKDIIFPTNEHGWMWNDKGTIRKIPEIIINWKQAAPDNQPTLFVYQGVMTCFFPPQGGV